MNFWSLILVLSALVCCGRCQSLNNLDNSKVNGVHQVSSQSAAKPAASSNPNVYSGSASGLYSPGYYAHQQLKTQTDLQQQQQQQLQQEQQYYNYYYFPQHTAGKGSSTTQRENGIRNSVLGVDIMKKESSDSGRGQGYGYGPSPMSSYGPPQSQGWGQSQGSSTSQGGSSKGSGGLGGLGGLNNIFGGGDSGGSSGGGIFDSLSTMLSSLFSSFGMDDGMSGQMMSTDQMGYGYGNSVGDGWGQPMMMGDGGGGAGGGIGGLLGLLVGKKAGVLKTKALLLLLAPIWIPVAILLIALVVAIVLAIPIPVYMPPIGSSKRSLEDLSGISLNVLEESARLIQPLTETDECMERIACEIMRKAKNYIPTQWSTMKPGNSTDGSWSSRLRRSISSARQEKGCAEFKCSVLTNPSRAFTKLLAPREVKAENRPHKQIKS